MIHNEFSLLCNLMESQLSAFPVSDSEVSQRSLNSRTNICNSSSNGAVSNGHPVTIVNEIVVYFIMPLGRMGPTMVFGCALRNFKFKKVIAVITGEWPEVSLMCLLQKIQA